MGGAFSWRAHSAVWLLGLVQGLRMIPVPSTTRVWLAAGVNGHAARFQQRWRAQLESGAWSKDFLISGHLFCVPRSPGAIC